MMISLPYHLPGRIFRSPMPFGPFDQDGLWQSYQNNHIDLVVVLTEPQEYLVYTARDLLTFYRDQGLQVIHLAIPDHQIPPDLEKWGTALDETLFLSRQGRNIAVHCLAGLGRTGMFLACLAIKELSLTGEQAIEFVRDYIPGAIVNPRQEGFVIHYTPN